MQPPPRGGGFFIGAKRSGCPGRPAFPGQSAFAAHFPVHISLKCPWAPNRAEKHGKKRGKIHAIFYLTIENDGPMRYNPIVVVRNNTLHNLITRICRPPLRTVKAGSENRRRVNFMEGIEKVVRFLDEAGTYYLATVEGDQPRVRPFGTALLYEGKLYIETGKVKNVSKQLAANPKAEICAFKDGVWLRVAGELVNDDCRDVKVAMLEKMPSLKGMYDPDDGNMQMLYFRNAAATFSSFTAAPETFTF